MNFSKKIGKEIACWIDAVFISMPGALGIRSRWWLYRGRFFHCGRQVTFSQNCRIKNFGKISLGDRVSFGPDVQLYAERSKQGIEIGDDASFNSNVMINADKGIGITIGRRVLVGPNVVFRAADHEFSRRDLPVQLQGDRPGRIVVEDDVWIGANAVILMDVTIRKGAVVAAGAVVTKDVGEYEMVGGVPARPIGTRGGPID